MKHFLNPPSLSRLWCAAALFLCGAALTSKAAPVVWGPSGVSSIDGCLDASLIPSSTGTNPVVFPNVNGDGYDIVLSTSNLGGDGQTTFMGDDGWWLEGSPPGSTSYSIVTFRFYQTGTNTPIGITGVNLVLQDAENREIIGGFSYFDSSGNEMPVLFNDPMFAYSYGAEFFLNYVEAANDAIQQDSAQDGKSIEINLSSTPISGFTFGLYRQDSTAGSVIMMGLGNLTAP
ncbi:MAG: hypothetical protein ABSE62_05185 [Chthoniobacteraceae bacterium]|jgi:hypothetical protein